VSVCAVEVDSFPQSRVHNSQPHGIGRVAMLGDLCAWNNLGRNVVFAGTDLRPRAVFDESAFSEDEPSQYDLDVHAILEIARAGIVITLNHFGMLRAFPADELRRPGPLRRVAPVWMRQFVADVERSVVVGERLLGSRPREKRLPGLLVTEPLTAQAARIDIEIEVQLEEWGMVTALAAVGDEGTSAVAVGGGGRVGLAPTADDGVGALRWEVGVDFEPAVLLWDGELVWAAGSEHTTSPIDDYDWEALRGGGFAALDPRDGRVVVSGVFGEELAWGNGGAAVAVMPGALVAIGRQGQLHVFDAHGGGLLASSAPLADDSLGIAHGAAVGATMLYGFNRGGYRLHALDLRPHVPSRRA